MQGSYIIYDYKVLFIICIIVPVLTGVPIN